MSYLWPQADEIVADNNRQPTDMTFNDWSAISDANAQATQSLSWLRRQPPRLLRVAEKH